MPRLFFGKQNVYVEYFLEKEAEGLCGKTGGAKVENIICIAWMR